MDKDTGGSAFPIFPETGGGHAAAFHGMTLRDYFAAKAMQGLLSGRPEMLLAFSKRLNSDGSLSDIAYQLSDGMLKTRIK